LFRIDAYFLPRWQTMKAAASAAHPFFVFAFDLSFSPPYLRGDFYYSFCFVVLLSLRLYLSLELRHYSVAEL
jgi:hypothetical protein